MFDLDEAFRSLAQKGYYLGIDGVECKRKNTYKYHFMLGDVCINVYNCNNTKIQIDGLQFKLDYNTMSINVGNAGIVDIYSLDELKHKVNEYRRAYKRINETMKKLQIEKDFYE